MAAVKTHTFCQGALEAIYPAANVRVADGDYYIPTRSALLVLMNLLMDDDFGWTSAFEDSAEFSLTADEFLRRKWRETRKEEARSVDEVGALVYPDSKISWIDNKLFYTDLDGELILPDRFNYPWLAGHAWGTVTGGPYKAVFWMADDAGELFYVTTKDGPIREADETEDVEAIRVGC